MMDEFIIFLDKPDKPSAEWDEGEPAWQATLKYGRGKKSIQAISRVSNMGALQMAMDIYERQHAGE